MKTISVNMEHARAFLPEGAYEAYKEKAEAAMGTLLTRNGAGNDFLGWIDLPVEYDREEFARIKAAAQKIREDSEVLVVIGIGGSYLGARAVIDGLVSPFAALEKVPAGNGKAPHIIFAGNQISTDYMTSLMKALEGRDFSVNVISKSGTTTEPAIAFRILKEELEKRYGKEGARGRIYATTDARRGALKTLATKEGYESFVVPDDVGGRFSVLTAVGLLPIAAAGIDIDELMGGAVVQREACLKSDPCQNPSIEYAIYRNALHAQGKSVEILANYEPALHYTSEWWKQLYGESEGKNGKGIFPASVDLTTDLHSMGQFIQDGTRLMMETVIEVEECHGAIALKAEAEDLDGLNYLAGRTMDFVNKNAMRGTMLAHVAGGVPVMQVKMPRRDAFSLGALMYFFEFACGISGYMLGVNPFDQPGVESYKKNMFALLGKPGYEALRKELLG